MIGGNSGFDDLANNGKVDIWAKPQPLNEILGVSPDQIPGGDTGFDDLAREPSIPERIGRQVNTAITNMGNTISGWANDVQQAYNNYENEAINSASAAAKDWQNGEPIDYSNPVAGYETPNYYNAKSNLYNEAIGKPAGYVAITPGLPGPVRALGGALAAPTIVSGTADAYSANVENNDSTPVLSTVKQTLIDPVIEPVKNAVSHPGEFVQNIADNPLNLWDNVFLPASVVEGSYKGAKAIRNRAKATPESMGETGFDDLNPERSQPVSAELDTANSIMGETGFDDLNPSKQRMVDVSDIPGETGDMATDIYNRYRMNGLTDAEAAGMVGNIAQESGFDPTAVSSDGYNTKTLIQLDSNRYANFEKWCADNGRDINDWRSQVDFSAYELKTYEHTALDNMRARGEELTPEEAAYIGRRDYERPDPSVANDAYRQKVAREVYEKNHGRTMSRNSIENMRDNQSMDNTVIDSEKAADVDLNPLRDRDVARDDINLYKDSTERIIRDEAGKAKAEEPSYDILRQRGNLKEDNYTPRAEEVDFPEDRVSMAGRDANGNPLPETKRGYNLTDQLGRKIVDQYQPGTVRTNTRGTVIPDTRILFNTADTSLPEFSTTEMPKLEASNTMLPNMEAPNTDIPNMVAPNAELPNVEAPRTEPVPMANSNVSHEITPGVQYSKTIRSMADDVNDASTKTANNPISRKEFISQVEKLFDMENRIRGGRVDKGALAQFDSRQGIIRGNRNNDFRTIPHELGHMLDKEFGFSKNPKYQMELKSVVYDRFGNAYNKQGLSSEEIAGEGVAEFLHDYVTDRAAAKKNFPDFYDHFERTIQYDKPLTGALNKLTELEYRWNNQGALERIKGRIDFSSDNVGFKGAINMLREGRLKDSVDKALKTTYTDIVDELQPLADVVAEVEERTGQKLDVSKNPFLQAWASRGWVGKAITLLEHGGEKYGFRVKPLKTILDMVGKDRLKEFSAYLTARRELDILKWNAEHAKEPDLLIKTTLRPVDVGQVIRKYARDKAFRRAEKELRNYQIYMLGSLMENGFLTRKAVDAMLKKYPHYVPFQRVVDLPDVGGTGKGTVNVGNPIKKMKGSTRDIIDPLESVITNTFKITNAIERNKVGRAFASLSRLPNMGDLVEAVKGTAKESDSTFSVWEAGKKRTYATTPELLKALKMTNEEGVNMLTKILRVPAGWLRAGATLSPEFILRNPVRDMISASLYSKHGFIPVWDTVRGLSLYLKKGKEYWSYMNSGAAEAAQVSLDRNYLHGQMRELLKKPSVLGMCAHPIEALRAFSEATEMATRLAEYDLAKKGYTGIRNRLFGGKRNPLSDIEAGIESRDVTIDFGRHGKSTRGANQTIAFWNAAIQGTDKMVREFKAHPGQMLTKATVGITLPSVLLWYLNKDDPRYQELPQWQKDIFWIIPGKNTLYKIPKPFELGVLFGSVPERVCQYMYDKEKGRNGAGFKGIGVAIAENMLPSYLPTGQLPMIEWITNYNFFTGRNIVPLSQQNLPDRDQYGPYTSYVARKIGDTFNLSPRKIDNTIRALGGNLAALVNTGIDSAAGLDESRPAKKLSESPGIRGFTATPYASPDSVQRVHDAYTEQDKLYKEYKITGKKPEGYDPVEHARMKSAVKALNRTYQAQKAVMNSKLSSKEKRDRLDNIKMSQTNISRKALGLNEVRQ